MEIKYFKLIKTIAEQGSIANATSKLFLTQSALSHQLKDLENQLGFKVFYRTRAQWKLTDEGHELYLLGNKILENIDASFKNIQQIRQGSIGNIKVSTECYSFYQGLPKFIQKMGLLYPEINVDLILEATHKPISKILSKDIDIAIVTSKPKNDLLLSIDLFDDEIYAVMHKENKLNTLDYISANHFSNTHLIIHSFPLETVSIYEHFLKPNNITPRKISAIPLTEVALELIEANFGLLCMPKWALKSFKTLDHLVFKKIGKKGLKRRHFLVIRKTDEQKKYIKDFISNFVSEFSI
ncbi:LysR family transcriptional regulator [Aquimarina agarilytica]|uniref:LysR family transcriptional regulator n=1 Tax=Aquimarina agarilytica TaxID=1087449 RepID=UPI000289436E|nr:LysR substrate-binding domain-containing protein [Aquimarina agarilytica]